jgi:hypothetical protein
MRIVFEVNILGYSSKGGYWTAMIELWNLSADMVQSFLYGQGATVTLSAGFQAGPYGVIFQGTVYQALYERVEVVDSKVTLMCYTGMKETIANFAVLRGDAQMTQAAIVAKMAAGSQNPFPIDLPIRVRVRILAIPTISLTGLRQPIICSHGTGLTA